MFINTYQNFIFFLCLFNIISSDQAKVSPKLDFSDETDKSDNAAIDNESVSPKINGIRITVDTSNVKKSVESKSDEDIVFTNINTGNTKKKIGVQTQVTFEITDDLNKTSSNEKNNNSNDNDDSDDDNASVPIFKGSRDHVNDNRNNNNRRKWNNGVGGTGVGPIFHHTDDENIRYGGIDNWSNFIPLTTNVWTTERPPNFYGNYKPGYQENINEFIPSYTIEEVTYRKPCLCEVVVKNNDGIGDRKRGASTPAARGDNVKRTVIDDKLDDPFSDHK